MAGWMRTEVELAGGGSFDGRRIIIPTDKLGQPFMLPADQEPSARVEADLRPLEVWEFRWDLRERTSDGCPIYRRVR